MPDLTGVPALDLAIGLSFIYLLLSLLASTVQEVISGLFALRATTLEQGLRNMLEPSRRDAKSEAGSGASQQEKQAEADAESSKKTLVDELYAHPLINALYKESWWPLPRRGRSNLWKDGRLPSYISPRSFALTLVDTLAPNALAPNHKEEPLKSHDALAAVRMGIDKTSLPIPEGTKRALFALIDNARGDIDAFRQGLEAWFDDAMARVSGWYKRKAQLILCGIALVVTVALNANTLTMAERLWKDPAVRTAVVQQASGSAVSGEAQGATPEDLKKAADNVDGVAKLGVPVGWSGSSTDPRHVDFIHPWYNWVAIVGGWFLTLAAVSLGAPFWFDTLSRLSRLRNSGKPETPLPASGRGQPNERVVT
jgi:hypothetical protein